MFEYDNNKSMIRFLCDLRRKFYERKYQCFLENIICLSCNKAVHNQTSDAGALLYDVLLLYGFMCEYYMLCEWARSSESCAVIGHPGEQDGAIWLLGITHCAPKENGAIFAYNKFCLVKIAGY